MKYTIVLLTIGIIILAIPIHFSEPGFNGTNPGCDGSGCHDLEDGHVSVEVTGLDVSITVSGATSSVAGELVDETGTVVAVNNSTGNNPFTLTAPGQGTYRVNAGFKNPNPRRWDSVMVDIGLTNVNENPISPNTFKLYDNFPNPFNPSTTVKYSLTKTSFTKIKIYDAVGNEVATLVNDIKTAGTHQVLFNAEGLSSGVYYYSINSGSFSETKKMVLIRWDFGGLIFLK